MINKYSSFIIHSGNKVSFWFDNWSGDEALYLAFPNIFSLVKDKFLSIAFHISPDGNWIFDFKRRLRNSEANQFANLLVRIGVSPPQLNDQFDTIRWSLGNNGVFSVKSLYAKLIEADGVADFPKYFIWNKIVPPNITFLLWCVVHGKLNTLDLLNRKGLNLDNCCIMCGNEA